jgi:hypothetical protein
MFPHSLLVLSLTLFAFIRAVDPAQLACISHDGVPSDVITVHPSLDGDYTANAILCTESCSLRSNRETLRRVVEDIS